MLSFAAVVVPDLRERPSPNPPVPESPILVPSTPVVSILARTRVAPSRPPAPPPPPASPSSPFPSVKRSRVIRSRVVPVSAATSPTAAGFDPEPSKLPATALRLSVLIVVDRRVVEFRDGASSPPTSAAGDPRRRPGHPRAPGPAPRRSSRLDRHALVVRDYALPTVVPL